MSISIRDRYQRLPGKRGVLGAGAGGGEGEGGLDFSAFATLPANDQADMESAGLSQAQVDLLASGQCWRNTSANQWQDTAGTTPVTATGQQVKRWRSWQGDVFTEATNGPTHQSDGLVFDGLNDILSATTSINVGAQNDRAFILLWETDSATNDKTFLTNIGTTLETREWFLTRNRLAAGDARFSVQNQQSADFTLTNALSFFTFRALTNSSLLKAWENNTIRLDTTIQAATANNGQNTLNLGGQKNTTLKFCYMKLRFFFAYSGNMSDANLQSVREAIELLEGTALLP